MQDFLRGMSYLPAGFELIARSGVKRFVILPLLINIIFFIALFLVLRHYIAELDHWFVHFLPMWLHWLSYLFWLIFIVSFFVIFIYFFISIANIIAAPFNSSLASHIQQYLTGKSVTKTWLEELKTIPATIGRQVWAFLAYTPQALALLILMFIPFLQVFAAPLWFIFNAWNLAFTYLDYPTELRGIRLATLKEWLRARKSLALGFGVAILICSLIPILNLFVIPAAVAGAVKLWYEENSH